jgi:hypothetical protein
MNKEIDMLRCVITEYDMKEAGFSLIKEFSLLPNNVISTLSKLTKQERTIRIGKLMKSDQFNLSEELMESFIEARRLFFESNELESQDILSIKKDAIFVIDKSCDYLDFGDNIHFVPKNKYSSFIKLDGIELYYSAWKDTMDIKKTSNKDNPLFGHIKKILKSNETVSKDNLFQLLQKFRSDYLNFRLETECYRELNIENKFRINSDMVSNLVLTDRLDESLVDYINIEYNYIHIVIPLISVLL